MVYNKNKFIYKHVSPLVKLFYYADEKYNISERDITKEEVGRIALEIIPKLVEDNIREFLAQKFGLSEAIIETKDYEVDVCLLRFNKPEMVVEVKWKEKLTKTEINRVEEVLCKVKAKKKYLFVQDKSKIKSKLSVDVVDITDFL